jgi:hypothetical protein
MKSIFISIALILVVYHTTAQVDTMNKNIVVKDSLHASINIFMRELPALSNGYYIHFPADTLRDYKRMPLFFHTTNSYQKFPSPGFWNTAGPILISFLAEQSKHQYFLPHR